MKEASSPTSSDINGEALLTPEKLTDPRQITIGGRYDCYFQKGVSRTFSALTMPYERTDMNLPGYLWVTAVCDDIKVLQLALSDYGVTPLVSGKDGRNAFRSMTKSEVPSPDRVMASRLANERGDYLCSVANLLVFAFETTEKSKVLAALGLAAKIMTHNSLTLGALGMTQEDLLPFINQAYKDFEGSPEALGVHVTASNILDQFNTLVASELTPVTTA